jgi:hypothetical protein
VSISVIDTWQTVKYNRDIKWVFTPNSGTTYDTNENSGTKFKNT